MAKLFFDRPEGIILIDGKKHCGAFAKVDGAFCIEYFPFSPYFFPVSYACDGRPSCGGDICFIRHGKDYIVRFFPDRKPISRDEEIYFEEIADCGELTSHRITCRCKDRHRIVVETAEEIYTLEAECRVTSCSFKSAPIGSGQLLSIFAKLENGKSYIAVLHYCGDYTLLLSLSCDAFECCEDGIIVYDCLCDTLDRKCVRKLAFCDDCFAETERHFEYGCRRIYPDELIPYVFLEALGCRDIDCAEDCLSYGMRDTAHNGFFGDFIGICDCLEYRPYVVSLIYSDCEGFYTKTYKFTANGGKISKVNLL